MKDKPVLDVVLIAIIVAFSATAAYEGDMIRAVNTISIVFGAWYFRVLTRVVRFRVNQTPYPTRNALFTQLCVGMGTTLLFVGAHFLGGLTLSTGIVCGIGYLTAAAVFVFVTASPKHA
jgi:hypothetical protein